MDEPSLPASSNQLKKRLGDLRNARQERHTDPGINRMRRKCLTPAERTIVLKRTEGRCHICGGKVATRWQADHVLAHNAGGLHSAENYLPAHTLCNNYRWDYDQEGFQWVLKIGVWARRQMESGTHLGSNMLEPFYKYEIQRHKRRSSKL
jgi:5-methylcytosine-specific restriction endonuclease McrA